jgi:hypothetical protein
MVDLVNTSTNTIVFINVKATAAEMPHFGGGVRRQQWLVTMHDVSHQRHKMGPRGPIVMYIAFVPDAGIGIAEVEKRKTEA